MALIVKVRDGKDQGSNDVDPLLKTVDVDAAVVAIREEGVHVELPIADQISLSDLQQRSRLGDAALGDVQEFSAERVDDEVNAAPASFRA